MRRIAILLAALGALLLVSAAPAFAAGELEFKETFGSAAQPKLGAPTGMAVDQATGDLYVIDFSDQTLHRFNPDGTPANFTALGANVIDGASGADETPSGGILSTEGSPIEAEVAVAPPSAGETAGDIYVTNAFNGEIDIFAPSGEYLGQESFGYPCGVAVDAAGTVYVGSYEANAAVYKMEPTAPGSLSEVAQFPTTTPCQVAAGYGPSAGYVFATEYAGAVTKLDATTGEEKYVVNSGGLAGLISVDPGSGYLYVTDAGGTDVTAFDVSGAGEATEVSNTTTSTVSLGVAVNGLSGDVYVAESLNEQVEVYAQPEEEPEPTSNRRTLTVTKSAGGTEGSGSVQSKPKGIKCGAACTEALASMYEATPVLLKAKPSNGSTFVEWTGACAGVEGPECTVPMTEAEEVGAVFGGVSKEILNPTGLTVNKGAGTGEGTVKGPGLGCEALCTKTTVLYQGPLTEPKVKPGKVVTLKQAPAFGSEFVGWTGCDEVNGEGNCVVEMSEAKTVSAEYAPLPNLDLTVHKGPYESGAGTVLSKPKGIACGSYCTQAIASMPEGAAVELKEKPAKENTFVKWEGGDCEGLETEVCVVTMDVAETITAVFTGPTKTINPAETLTVSKGESSAFGTVKGAGLKCEFLCTSESVIYQGPITLPKEKAGKTVVLKSIAAPGSASVLWGGCDSIDEEGNCVVEMSEPKTVTGTFEELE
ncbi:MAG: NHL repeat-containing protein [Chloroflexota bacterium]